MIEPAHVLCADPPWRFQDALPGKSRGASNNYKCLTVQEIAAFPLPLLADDAVLCLWRPASFQLEALAVIEAWGFPMPCAELVWIKTVNAESPWPSFPAGFCAEEGQLPCPFCSAPGAFVYHGGRDPCPNAEPPEKHLRIGMGRLVRNVHETMLIAKRGKVQALDNSIPSVVFAPRGRHSEKPEIVYDLIERLVPGPFTELFARRQRSGWTCFGDELQERAAE